MDKLLINNVFYYLFNVAFPTSTRQRIADAVVFKIMLVVVLKQAFPVNVEAVHFLNHVGFGQVADIVVDGRWGDILTLRLHEFRDAIGRDEFPCVVGEEARKVLQKSRVADFIAHDDILQQNGMVNVHLILAGIFRVKADFHQTRQSAKLDIFGQRIIIVSQVVKSQKFLITKRLDLDFLVAPTYERAQFITQHLGVAPRDDDFCVRLRAVTSHRALKLCNILNLIN